MPELKSFGPLPEAQFRPRDLDSVLRGGKLIDVEIFDSIISGADIDTPDIDGGTIDGAAITATDAVLTTPDINTPDIDGGTIDDVTIDGGWQTFTPTLVATTANPTLGSGSTQSGRYQTIGNLCIMHITIAFGSSGAAAGTGTYQVLFAAGPAIGGSVLGVSPIGVGYLTQSGVAEYSVICKADTANFNRVTMRYHSSGSTSNVGVTHSTPFAWGNNDSIRIQLMYEID